MAGIFSTSWKASKDPRKQKKYRFNAPTQTAAKMMSSRLAKELKEKIGKRALPVRTGDKVKIEVGNFKGKMGKIESVDRKNMKVYIEKVESTKKDGSKIRIPVDPSNLTILELNMEDKRRLKRTEKK